MADNGEECGVNNCSDRLADEASYKNLKEIHCQLCDSKILLMDSCCLVEKEFCLPFMKVKDKDGKSLNGKTETIGKFWLVNDMMTFENVGFTKTVSNLKYLICADCEVGPIGYQDIENPKMLYVAFNRVQYK